MDSVVIDLGSTSTKYGFSGTALPKAVLPTVIGKSKLSDRNIGSKDTYVGNEAQLRREFLCLRRPIEFGQIVDYESFEYFLHHIGRNSISIT